MENIKFLLEIINLAISIINNICANKHIYIPKILAILSVLFIFIGYKALIVYLIKKNHSYCNKSDDSDKH